MQACSGSRLPRGAAVPPLSLPTFVSRFQGLGLRVERFWCRVCGGGFRVSGFFCLGSRVSGFSIRVLLFRVSGVVFRHLGLLFKVPSLGFRLSSISSLGDSNLVNDAAHAPHPHRQVPAVEGDRISHNVFINQFS